MLRWTHSQEPSKNNYSMKLLGGTFFFPKKKLSYFIRCFLGVGGQGLYWGIILNMGTAARCDTLGPLGLRAQ